MLRRLRKLMCWIRVRRLLLIGEGVEGPAGGTSCDGRGGGKGGVGGVVLGVVCTLTRVYVIARIVGRNERLRLMRLGVVLRVVLVLCLSRVLGGYRILPDGSGVGVLRSALLRRRLVGRSRCMIAVCWLSGVLGLCVLRMSSV